LQKNAALARPTRIYLTHSAELTGETLQ